MNGCTTNTGTSLLSGRKNFVIPHWHETSTDIFDNEEMEQEFAEKDAVKFMNKKLIYGVCLMK